jgi:molecular chaperone Hsp33
MSVVRSIPGKTISSAMINVSPASLKEGVKEYFTKSLQRHVELVVEAHSTTDGVDFSRALLVECMPDGDKRTFKKFCRRIEKGIISEAMRKACSIEDLCVLFNAGICKVNEPQELVFKCRCSIERVEKMVNGLPDADIKDMIHGSQPTQIVCHMCGEGYRVGKELLWSILEKRGHDLDLGEEFDYD